MSILAQQVSLESAQAAFNKLQNALETVNPEQFLSLDEEALRAIGFSRQKASYVRGLAQDIIAGKVDLAALELLDNDNARNSLMDVKGVGPWTAEAYLLFALRRPDVWPPGDLALAKAVQEIRGLGTTPAQEELNEIADRWRPLRAVAARLLWHNYLCQRGRNASA